MSAVRVGVIGCGRQGQAHLRSLAEIEGIELVAIADLDAERLTDVGDRFEVTHRHVDAAELLEHPLDLVSVCTMPDTHRDLVVGAFEHGAHVLCEKPLARNCAEAVEMVRAAERADRLLMIGFNMRYTGETAAVRRFMDEGLLGDLVCVRGYMLGEDVPWWGRHHVRALSGGGALASSTVHMLDLLLWLADYPRPLTATASMTTLFPRKRAAGAPAGAAEVYDVEDVVFGHVRFEGGFWLSLEGGWMFDRPGCGYGFDMLGSSGQAHLRPLELYTEREGKAVRVLEDASSEPDFHGALRHELADVVDSVRTGRAASRLATGRQALVVQAVVDALYRSADDGREVAVDVPDAYWQLPDPTA